METNVIFDVDVEKARVDDRGRESEVSRRVFDAAAVPRLVLDAKQRDVQGIQRVASLSSNRSRRNGEIRTVVLIRVAGGGRGGVGGGKVGMR